jgi:hypothetical protein
MRFLSSLPEITLKQQQKERNEKISDELQTEKTTETDNGNYAYLYPKTKRDVERHRIRRKY